VNNASKVHTALKLSQDDQQTITTLRSEVEKAWKMVDTAQSKETSAKETITSLKEEIANLSGLVEKSAALTGTQEGMVQELTAADFSTSPDKLAISSARNTKRSIGLSSEVRSRRPVV
jgi:predicted translin family RNA/ssDNA-binding protein